MSSDDQNAKNVRSDAGSGEEAAAAGYGQGNRGDYYNKWDKFVKEEVANTEDEEKAEQKASDAALGLDGPRSEAEAKDRAKREQLKKMKAEWEEKKASEKKAKKFITLTSETEGGDPVVVESATMEGLRVLVFKDCTNVVFRVTATPLIKLFIEGCESCKFTLGSGLLTSFAEVNRCKNVEIDIQAVLSTLQIDLSENIRVHCLPGTLDEATGTIGLADYVPAKPRIIHAGTTGLQVTGVTGSGCHVVAPSFCFQEQEGVDTAAGEVVAPLNEIQWVTQLFRGQFEVARLVRVGARHLTRREIDEENRLQDVKPIVAADPGTEARLMATAEAHKADGNQAFAQQNYMQAMASYTMAIEEAPPVASVASESNKGKPLVALCHLNRSACFLKLGEHIKALEDSERCISLAPTFVKGYFRKGLALHALERFSDALPVLAKAQKMEPKNQQIKEALKFAEFRLQKQMREARN